MYTEQGNMDRFGRTEYKIREYGSLKDAEWNLDMQLKIHLGLIDRSLEVSIAAMDALLGLARRYPDAPGISPVSMAAYFIFTFPVATGYRALIFRELCEIGSDAADLEVLGLMDDSIRNEDFKEFLEILVELGKTGVLSNLRTKEYSRNKAKILGEIMARTPVSEKETPNSSCNL